MTQELDIRLERYSSPALGIFRVIIGLMFACHGAATQGREPDRAFRPCAGDAVAAAFGVVCQADAASSGSGFAQQQSGAGGGIDFHPVVHFDHFDVPVIAQLAGRFAHQVGKQGDAE